MTSREQSALARISAVIAGWLLALAAVVVILLVQGKVKQMDDKAQQEREDRQAQSARIDYSQLEARACQMTACERMK